MGLKSIQQGSDPQVSGSRVLHPIQLGCWKSIMVENGPEKKILLDNSAPVPNKKRRRRKDDAGDAG